MFSKADPPHPAAAAAAVSATGGAGGLSDRFSLVELRRLYQQLVQNKEVNDSNQGLVIEILRVLAEMVVYGDNKSEMLFDFFCEKNMLSLFLEIMWTEGGCPSEVHIQILQTLSILISCVRNDTSLYYLLSNNRINEIIIFSHDFDNDESLCAQFASFMKSISLKLNIQTVQFFFIEETGAFPILSRAVELLHIPDPMIRIASQSTILNVYKVEDPRARAYALQDDVMQGLFQQIVKLMMLQFDNILKTVQSYYNHSLTTDEAAMKKAEDHLDDLLASAEDWFYYLQDLLDLPIPELKKALITYLVSDFILPVLFTPIVQQFGPLVCGDIVDSEAFGPTLNDSGDPSEASPSTPPRPSPPSQSMLGSHSKAWSSSCSSMKAMMGRADSTRTVAAGTDPIEANKVSTSLAYLLQILRIVSHPLLHRTVIVGIFHPLSLHSRNLVLGEVARSKSTHLSSLSSAARKAELEAAVQRLGMLEANPIKLAWEQLHYQGNQKIVLIASYISQLIYEKIAAEALEMRGGFTTNRDTFADMSNSSSAVGGDGFDGSVAETGASGSWLNGGSGQEDEALYMLMRSQAVELLQATYIMPQLDSVLDPEEREILQALQQVKEMEREEELEVDEQMQQLERLRADMSFSNIGRNGGGEGDGEDDGEKGGVDMKMEDEDGDGNLESVAQMDQEGISGFDIGDHAAASAASAVSASTAGVSDGTARHEIAADQPPNSASHSQPAPAPAPVESESVGNGSSKAAAVAAGTSMDSLLISGQDQLALQTIVDMNQVLQRLKGYFSDFQPLQFLETQLIMLQNAPDYSLVILQTTAHAVFALCQLLQGCVSAAYCSSGHVEPAGNAASATAASEAMAATGSSTNNSSGSSRTAPQLDSTLSDNAHYRLLAYVLEQLRNAVRFSAMRLADRLEGPYSDIILNLIKEEMHRYEGRKWKPCVKKMHQDITVFLPPVPFNIERFGLEFEIPISQVELIRKNIQSFLLVRALYKAAQRVYLFPALEVDLSEELCSSILDKNFLQLDEENLIPEHLHKPDAPFDMRGKRFLDVYLSEPTTGGADGMGLNQSEGISTGSAVGSHGGGGGLGAGVSPTSSTLWNSALSSMGYGRGGTHGSSHNASTPTTATVSRRSFSFVPNTSSSSGNSSSSSIGVGPGRAAGGRPLSGSLSPVSTSQLQQNKRHKLLFVQDDNLLIVVSALKNKLTNKNAFKTYVVAPLLYTDAQVDQSNRKQFTALIRSAKPLPHTFLAAADVNLIRADVVTDSEELAAANRQRLQQQPAHQPSSGFMAMLKGGVSPSSSGAGGAALATPPPPPQMHQVQQVPILPTVRAAPRFLKPCEKSSFWHVSLSMDNVQASRLATHHIESRRKALFAEKKARLHDILREWVSDKLIIAKEN